MIIEGKTDVKALNNSQNTFFAILVNSSLFVSTPNQPYDGLIYKFVTSILHNDKITLQVKQDLFYNHPLCLPHPKHSITMNDPDNLIEKMIATRLPNPIHAIAMIDPGDLIVRMLATKIITSTTIDKDIIQKLIKSDTLSPQNKQLVKLFIRTLCNSTQIRKQNKMEIINIELKKKNTLSHFAAEAGDLELMDLLFKNGANFNIKNESGKTPLMILLEQKDINDIECLTEIFKKIIENPAKVTALKNGVSQIFWYSGNCEHDTIDNIIRHADLVRVYVLSFTIQDKLGNTILHYLVRYLNKIPDDKQQQATQLMAVFFKENHGCFKALTMLDEQEKTPTDLATQPYIKKYLQKCSNTETFVTRNYNSVKESIIEFTQCCIPNSSMEGLTIVSDLPENLQK